MKKIENVGALLFDLGGVVIDIDFDRVFQHWAPHSHYSLDQIRQQFSMDDHFQQHERGEIDDQSYIAHLRQTYQLRGSDEDIAQGWNNIFIGEISSTLALIQSIKHLIPCFAFTNTNAIHQAEWSTRFSQAMSSFEKVFVSSELGLRKPELEAFTTVGNTICADLSKILFFDDSLDNVNGAIVAGLQAVHVNDPDDVNRALASAGLLLSLIHISEPTRPY